MKITEKTLIGIFFLGLLFKVFHLPGGDFIALLSGALLAMFYYVSGYFLINDVSLRKLLKERKGKDVSPPVLFGSILAGWDFSLIILGLLFKVLLFPGGDNMLIIGIIFLTLLQIGSIAIRKKNPEAFSRFFNRVLIWFGLGIAATFISYDQLIDHTYGKDPAYAEAMKAYMKNPQDSATIYHFEQEDKRWREEHSY